MRALTIAIAIAIAAALPAEARAEPEPAGLAKRLQQGLVEEEVNRDPMAAIEHYEKLLEEFDAGRQFAATALFRTAECHRKLGDEKAAAESLSQLVALFPEQEKLVALARQNLAALGVAAPKPVSELELTAQESERLKELRTLVRDSPDLISSGTSSHLHDAIKAGHATATHFLLENGANPNQAVDTSYSTPQGAFKGRATMLTLATATGNHRIVEMLLAKGATVPPRSLTTAIQTQHQTIEATLLGAIQARHGDFDFFEPLATATQIGWHEALDRLVASGADPKATNSDGDTLLHVLVGTRHMKMYAVLINTHGVPVDGRNALGLSALDLAVAGGLSEEVEVLLAAGADPKGVAATHAHHPGAENFEGLTPLMQALGPSYARHNATVLPILEQLIAAGADVNQRDANGNTALHYAVAHSVSANVDTLADPSSDFSDPKEKGTRLLEAWDKAVIALLDAGADPSAANDLGVPPIAYARDTALYPLLYNRALIESPARSTSVLIRTKGESPRVAATQTDADQSPPTLAELLIQGSFGDVAPSDITIFRMDEPEPTHYDLIKIASGANPVFPEIQWGDLVELEPRQYLNSVGLGAIRDQLLPLAGRTVTVARGGLEATFTVTPRLPGLPESWGLYDPSSGVVRDTSTPLELAKNAFLLTPFTSRSVAKLIRADGESLVVSLVDGATDQPQLEDGDRLEITEGEHRPSTRHSPAITCDERLLYWACPVDGGTTVHRDITLADLIGVAYSSKAPHVIRHPEFENMELRLPNHDGEGDVDRRQWDFSRLLTEPDLDGFLPEGATLNIPLKADAGGAEDWTRLPEEVFAWLEKHLARTVEIHALDQPPRTLKIAPQLQSYRSSAGQVFRSPVKVEEDEDFDARGLMLTRLLNNAGYGDTKLYNIEGAVVSNDGGRNGVGGAVWLWDGAKISISAPRTNPRAPSAAALEAIRRAQQNAAPQPQRAPRRRVVLPPNNR